MLHISESTDLQPICYPTADWLEYIWVGMELYIREGFLEEVRPVENKQR